MIKRIVGGALTLVGAYCLFHFTARAMFHGRDLFGSGFDADVAFRALGRNYPADILFLLGAAWSFFLGLWLVVAGTDAPSASSGPSGGRIAKATLVNGLLLVSTLVVLYVGAKSKTEVDAGAVAVFTGVALLQVVVGLLLVVLGFMERPKGWVSLGLGTIVWLVGVGGTAFTFVLGKGA